MPAQRTYSQAKYWLLTIPHAHFLPYLPTGCSYIKGQLELGKQGSDLESTGSGSYSTWESNEYTRYLHWQIVVHFQKKLRLRGVRNIFGNFHAEPTRSEAADDYVWKDHTRVQGTQFRLGKLPSKRGDKKDWEAIRDMAKSGDLDNIPADVYVRNYNSLRRIETDNLKPLGIQRRIRVYWGPTGVGKSRRAWEEAGTDAYPKDPRTKFWDGYRNHTKVVMDEFRGGIDISHILRWFDRYPVIVEVKGSSTVLKADEIWITSNLHPHMWYPALDEETRNALFRRLEIVEMN